MKAHQKFSGSLLPVSLDVKGQKNGEDENLFKQRKSKALFMGVGFLYQLLYICFSQTIAIYFFRVNHNKTMVIKKIMLSLYEKAFSQLINFENLFLYASLDVNSHSRCDICFFIYMDRT